MIRCFSAPPKTQKSILLESTCVNNWKKFIFSDYLGSTGEEVSASEKMSPRLNEDSEFFLRSFVAENVESETRSILQFDFSECSLVDNLQTKGVMVGTTVQSTGVTCVILKLAG